MKQPKSGLLTDVTSRYLAGPNLPVKPLSDAQRLQVAAELMTLTVTELEAANALQASGSKYRIPDDVSPYQVAELILHFEDIANILMNPTDMNTVKLGLYQHDGPAKGTYVLNAQAIRQLVRTYAPSFTKNEVAEAVDILEAKAIVRDRTRMPELVPVNNGVFDYKQKVLLDFTPDYVFLSKCQADYNPNSVNPVIHNDEDNTDWDVESWLSELSDDPEIVGLLWQIIGAVVRPFVPWNKSAWLYSTKGNNGKGTFCALLRNLLGPGAWAGIPLNAFGKDFQLHRLLTTTAIINDENDVGDLIDKAGVLKSIVTQDVFMINPKYEKAYSFQFFGYMVQCFNEYPRIKDKSDSMARRILLIPFDKCFTGAERKYIKTDYLARKDVLEYVLFKVLNMNYYELSTPAACAVLLNEYKTYNNPLREFLDDILPNAVWTLLPFDFLYALYKSWFARNAPNGRPVNKSRLIVELQDLVPEYGWAMPDKSTDGKFKKIWAKGRIQNPEPMILEYETEQWYNDAYRGPDPMKRAFPSHLAVSYRGIYKPLPGAVAEDGNEPDEEPFPVKDQ